VRPDGVRPLFVDEAAIGDSVHGKWRCTDCHAGVDKFPSSAIAR
jgi:hypothetical protein